MQELNDSEIEELSADLRALGVELEAHVEAGAEGARTVDLDQPIGRISRVDALQQQAMAKASKRNLEVRLAQVRSAMSSLESGDYGYCRSCEEPIGFRRLKSRPETPFCVQCQGRRERGA